MWGRQILFVKEAGQLKVALASDHLAVCCISCCHDYMAMAWEGRCVHCWSELGQGESS